MRIITIAAFFAVAAVVHIGNVSAQATRDVAAPTAPLAPGYRIGPDDVLSIVFWRDKELSAEVTVRPDGKITLPLLNDVHAAGLTPEELRLVVVEGAQRFFEQPNAMVIVKEVRSRKVFITGYVEKPGPYDMTPSMTVMQLIATAGGLREFTKGKKILIMRNEGGSPVAFTFNYEQVSKQRNLRQNIELRPGDTVVVP
jgi:polysaccharide export outer membrane protein